MTTVTITIQTADETLVRIGSRVLEFLSTNSAGNGNKSEKKVERKSHAGNGMEAEVKTEAIELLKQGVTTEAVSKKTGLPMPKVRAYKAHITMGTY